MLLIVSYINLTIEEVIEVGNLLKPKDFGVNPLVIAKGFSKDVRWLRERYRTKDKKYQK